MESFQEFPVQEDFRGNNNERLNLLLRPSAVSGVLGHFQIDTFTKYQEMQM